MRHNFFFQPLRAVTVGVLVSQLAFPLGAQEMSPQQQSAKPEMGGEMASNQAADRQGRIEIVPATPPELAVENTPVATMKAAPVAKPLSPDGKILMVLDRFTYGARPGDLERVRAMGLSEWFHQQLNPQLIGDSALNARLAEFPAMKMPLNRMLAEFPPNDVLRAAANDRGAGGAYGDAASQAIFRMHVEEYKAREENKKKEGKAPQADPTMMAGDAKSARDSRQARVEDLPMPMEQILAMEPDARYRLILKLTPGQMRELQREMPEDRRGTGALMAGFTPVQREMMLSIRGTEQVIGSEAVETKLLRDIYSERQLQEVMVDFWLNHFNVYMRKSQQAPYYIAAYERDVIRPYALGNFQNLLLATAQSPAMLDYLDQKESIGPHSEQAMNGGGYGKNKAGGLNENYAREVMELHTIGVDGGYTQKDVTELAKVFTGWTVQAGYRKVASRRGRSTTRSSMSRATRWCWDARSTTRA